MTVVIEYPPGSAGTPAVRHPCGSASGQPMLTLFEPKDNSGSLART